MAFYTDETISNNEDFLQQSIHKPPKKNISTSYQNKQKFIIKHHSDITVLIVLTAECLEATFVNVVD